jgi:hypothetical protein
MAMAKSANASPEDRFERLLEVIEAQAEREERLVRALEGIVICEQRKLAQTEENKRRAMRRAGQTTPEAIERVRKVIARRKQ